MLKSFEEYKLKFYKNGNLIPVTNNLLNDLSSEKCLNQYFSGKKDVEENVHRLQNRQNNIIFKFIGS